MTDKQQELMDLIVKADIAMDLKVRREYEQAGQEAPAPITGELQRIMASISLAGYLLNIPVVTTEMLTMLKFVFDNPEKYIKDLTKK